VSSKTRRNLLVALWRDGARGTASSLARRAAVPLGASYAELQAMRRAGLARESLDSGRVVYEAENRNPNAAALKKLVSAPLDQRARPTPDLDRRWDAVRSELAAQGAPLWPQRRRVSRPTPLEELLAQACELSHHDPSVAKVLPYLFHKRKSELDFGRLEHALAENKQKHTAGFLLAVAGTLTDDATLCGWAERLRDKRRTKVVDFFSGVSGKRLQALAERNTPELAGRWNFRLNMPMDDFHSLMVKFGSDDHIPS
jgi:hypothetical protein